MKKRSIWITTLVAGGLAVGGATFAAAATDTSAPADSQSSTTTVEYGTELGGAIDAALAEVPGTATDAEAKKDGTYEVEIRTDKGTEVEVTLDKSLTVTGQHTDKDDKSDHDDRSDKDDKNDHDDANDQDD